MLDSYLQIKDGDEIEENDSEVGEQGANELLDALNGILSGATKSLPEELRSTLEYLVI